MDEKQIKLLIAWNVINQIKDKSIQTIIRNILFYEDSKINWDFALEQLKLNMPELEL